MKVLQAVFRDGITRVKPARERQTSPGHIDELIIKRVLFDTGALHANYISQDFVQQHQSILDPYIYEDDGTETVLADGETRVTNNLVTILTIGFKDNMNIWQYAELPFRILKTMNSMIIGLPAILSHFCHLLVSMLYGATTPAITEDDVERIVNNIETDIIDPWLDDSLNIAPEDVETPIPSSFPSVLNFMEMTHEQAVNEFISLIPTQVAPEFFTGTKKPLKRLLLTLGVRVFVPTNWEGIRGIESIDIETLPTLPSQHRPKARPISPKLWEHAARELKRLMGYMYQPSTSPIASPIVVAPKETPPFIRICGDYTWLNIFLLALNFPIPHVLQALAKICAFAVFLDLDMTNSFHQLPLSERSSRLLSVVTPLGQFEPKFLPEGIPMASQMLQKVVTEIFADFMDWMIVIFDNFLILAHNYDDAYDKLELVLKRCIERNLILKFKKSFLGFNHANFFGYECRSGSYKLSDKRKLAIENIPFPTKLKEMQSFLGAANFFSTHVPRYSELTAPLFDMVRKNFDWTRRESWKFDYEQLFKDLKTALLESSSVFYPDYSLDWVLRTDASIVGVSGALFQLLPKDNNELDWQPIGFTSHKFSEVATRWNTIEQECYGCYSSFLAFEHMLRGKHFILETDHRNLIWMEKSIVPKIVRWVLYMKSFSFAVRHVPGKLNIVADHMSRYFINNLVEPMQTAFPSVAMRSLACDSMLLHALSLPTCSRPVETGGESYSRFDIQLSLLNQTDLDDILRQCHNAKRGHWGVRQTMRILDKDFPGHRVPAQMVSDFISRCSICQKNRQDMVDSLQPVVRHLKPDHIRKAIGVDTLTITPADVYGNKYLIVVVVHFSKLAWGYPAADKEANTLVRAITTFYSIYGRYEYIYSDPGSDLTSKVMEELNDYYGVKHVISLVDRHESNGVEGTNKQILRHLRALVQEERIIDRWSAPNVLPLIFFILNSHESHETGITPFEAHFGTDDSSYFDIPEHLSEKDKSSEMLRQLNDSLTILRQTSKAYQDKIIDERTKKNDERTQNMYQPGDFVLLISGTNNPKSSKLAPHYAGPYEVIIQRKNDVTVRHLATGQVYDFHVERLKRFFGSKDDAKTAAYIDFDQYEIKEILAYRGDPDRRQEMQFEVLFNDGDLIWKHWDTDLTATAPFEDFCNTRPELNYLLTTQEARKKWLSEVNRSQIMEFIEGEHGFADIRYKGYTKYSSLDLPDHDHKTYLVEFICEKLIKNGREAKLYIPLSKKRFEVKHEFLVTYGSYKSFPDNDRFVQITQEFMKSFQKIKFP